jgi:pyruvate/2-oxoglutarate dehydrogenase complex dihydrolipoamide dehydrogenase (E3) component
VIRSARTVAEIYNAHKYGVAAGAPEVDFAAVMERMRKLRADISNNDSASRFRDLGVDVFLGEGRFVDSNTVEVGDKQLTFKKAVIATGARAAQPSVPGLAEAGYLTNETVFSLTERPRRLAVIGGGPIGCELAQAFHYLGSQVILLHKNANILDREDPDAASILQQKFVYEGMQLALNARLQQVEVKDGQKIIHYTADGKPTSVTVDEILVGAGRQPNIESLNLDAVGVRYHPRRGVMVNDNLRTANPNIYAAGDVCMKWKFTHAADAAARIVIKNTLFSPFGLGQQKLSSLTMPWCTYTLPEVAHVGLYEREAKEKGMDVDTFYVSMSDVDRAIADGDEEGFVKIHVSKGSDRIVGATIVAPNAGDMVSELTVAMVGKVGLKTISRAIHPYPTQAEAIKKAADAYKRTLLTPRVFNLFSQWMKWQRR